MERAKGIEPSSPAWKAGALPLCYARTTRARKLHHRPAHRQDGRTDWPRSEIKLVNVVLGETQIRAEHDVVAVDFSLTQFACGQTGSAGFELPMAKRAEDAECYKLLASYPDASLRDAVGYYIARKAQFAATPAVAAGVEQIVSELTGKRGERTVDNLRQYWRRFTADFGNRGFAEVEPDEITGWLDRTASHPTTRHNYRRAIVRLFNVTTDKKWRVETPAPAVCVLSLRALARLQSAARPRRPGR